MASVPVGRIVCTHWALPAAELVDFTRDIRPIETAVRPAIREIARARSPAR